MRGDIGRVLASLVYVSKSVLGHPAGPDQLSSIKLVSIARNSQHDLTGALLATPTHFAQYLEGRRRDLDIVMASIGADPRHVELRVRDGAGASQRVFPHWRMACFGPTTFVDRHVQPLLERHHGEPTASAAAAIVLFLRRLVSEGGGT